MKRLFTVFTITILLSVFAMPGRADFNNHPRFAHIDTLAKALITKVQIAQANYFGKYGKYFQGLTTPEYPLDGISDVSINWNRKPSDQDHTWRTFDSEFFKARTDIPFQMRIDVYESPDGWGWVLTLEVWMDGLGPDSLGSEGHQWIYRHHEGPEEVDLKYYDKWLVIPDNPI